MSPEIFTVVMFGAMILMVICGFGLLAVLLLGGGIFIARRIGKVHQDAGQALAEDMEAFFARSASELYPLSAAALSDVSSQLEIKGQAALGNVHYRGRLHSLSQPERGWMDFILKLKFGKGNMQLCTSRRRLQLTFGGIGVREVQLAVDEQPFGMLRDEGEVSLWDSQGCTVGKYARHPLAVGGLAVEPAKFNFKPYYGLIEVGGRSLAELNRNPLILRPRPGAVKQIEIMPLFRQVASDLSPDEEAWLLLLAGWEVYVKILTR